MTEVNDVILARQDRHDAFTKMLGWSLLLHAGLVVPVLLGIVDLGLDDVEVPRTVMTISLAGAPGPRTGDTPMGGREVVATPTPPTPAPPRPAPAPAPAPARPTVTPAPARPAPPPRANAPATRPQPASPEEAQPGSTRTETGARGRGFGLATGGGGGAGVQLDTANFCCPEYISRMVELIQQNWNRNQGIAGSTIVRFTITRNGTIEQVQVSQTSGFQALDNAAQLALLRTRLPELPPQYPNPALGVHVTFEYRR